MAHLGFLKRERGANPRERGISQKYSHTASLPPIEHDIFLNWASVWKGWRSLAPSKTTTDHRDIINYHSRTSILQSLFWAVAVQYLTGEKFLNTD